MSNQNETTNNKFLKNETLKHDHSWFLATLFYPLVGYIIVTLILNAIRVTAPLWIVWLLIIVQILLYISIFVINYRRAVVMGLNKYTSLGLFSLLAVLGRINDWELAVLPLIILIMFLLSRRNKKISKKSESLLPKNNTENL